MLATTRTVIVDEIHAVAGSKRGAHLALSLERLDALAGRRVTRIGLSATQKPIAEVARLLVGVRGLDAEGNARCRIVDSGHERHRDLALELPDAPLEAVMSNEVWTQIYDRLAQLVREHRTTLVFVNTRRLAERVARHCPSDSIPSIGRRASRQPRARAALQRRAATEARRAEGAGRDCVARARHRYRRRRSRVPAQLAALDQCVSAARRPLGSRRRRHAEGPAVSAVARRSRRMHGAARQRAAWRARSPEDSADVDGRAVAADRRRSRRRAIAARASCSSCVAAPIPIAHSRASRSTSIVHMLAEGFTHATRPARRAAVSRCA